MRRMLCMHSRIDISKVNDGKITPKEWPALVGSAGKLSEAPIHIIDKNSLRNITELDAEIERLKTECHIELLIIDDIEQLISATQGDGMLVYHHLFKLTEKFDIPIMIVTQLKTILAQAKSYLSLPELKEAESVADLVIVMGQNKSVEQDKSIVEIKIVKNRIGPVGKFDLRLVSERFRFEEI